MNSAFGFGQRAEFSVNNGTFKFPDTEQGDIVSHAFIVTNKGDSPLILNSYKVTCECTTVSLPKHPVLPGDTVEIVVTFDTKGKYYYQDRVIYIEDNTKKGVHKLRIKINVVEPGTLR